VPDRIAKAAGIERAPGAVQSIPIGSPDDAFTAAQRLQEVGVLVGCFRPPTVPDGISRLRLTARATVDVERAVLAASEAARLASAPAPAPGAAVRGEIM
jgi:8-amino-7-oxononanoate synthase